MTGPNVFPETDGYIMEFPTRVDCQERTYSARCLFLVGFSAELEDKNMTSYYSVISLFPSSASDDEELH